MSFSLESIHAVRLVVLSSFYRVELAGDFE